MFKEKKRPLHVEKERIRVIIFTQHYKVVGDLYLPKGGRLTDFLNKTLSGIENDVFIPVTDAECFSIEDGKLKYVNDFIVINKNHIHFLFPYK